MSRGSQFREASRSSQRQRTKMSRLRVTHRATMKTMGRAGNQAKKEGYLGREPGEEGGLLGLTTRLAVALLTGDRGDEGGRGGMLGFGG
ncbi:uncharacterized protein DS421_8g246760 [Arachis hypogaea]|nr:uncharacterized protein DS421_8g246760 [Arachis hypogaea]